MPISSGADLSSESIRYGTKTTNQAQSLPSNLAAMAAAAVAVVAATASNPSPSSTPSTVIQPSIYPQVTPSNEIGAQLITPQVPTATNNSANIAPSQAADPSISTWSQDSHAYLNSGTAGNSSTDDSTSAHPNLVRV